MEPHCLDALKMDWKVWRSLKFSGLTLLLCSLGVTAVLTFFIFPSSSNSFKKTVNQSTGIQYNLTNSTIRPLTDAYNSSCDLSSGRWVRDGKGARYSNWSCLTIPSARNCFRHGRRDADFVNWRWKPDGCELPRFDPRMFLKMFRGKRMGLIGDSVARNHRESLLCVLSTEENPKDLYEDPEDHIRIYYFPRHDFTLMFHWSKFLLSSEERIVNNSKSDSYDIYLDKIDNNWASNLRSLDYAVISSGHWFFRKLYLYDRNQLLGCVYCFEPNVTDLSLGYAVRMSFRAALDHIKSHCTHCGGEMVTLVRTFSPAHFENGTWNHGGKCPKTGPVAEAETTMGGGVEWELRRIQLEEVERARGESVKVGRRFGVMDVTGAMLMRPDGHPGVYSGNAWMKGMSDCIHWCMPGPIDAWNDFLMAALLKEAGNLVL